VAAIGWFFFYFLFCCYPHILKSALKGRCGAVGKKPITAKPVLISRAYTPRFNAVASSALSQLA